MKAERRSGVERVRQVGRRPPPSKRAVWERGGGSQPATAREVFTPFGYLFGVNRACLRDLLIGRRHHPLEFPGQDHQISKRISRQGQTTWLVPSGGRINSRVVWSLHVICDPYRCVSACVCVFHTTFLTSTDAFLANGLEFCDDLNSSEKLSEFHSKIINLPSKIM